MNVEFKEEVNRAIHGDALFTFVTFRTPYGPSETLERFTGMLEELGWRVEFKANWWTAEIPYGIIRVDISKEGEEKVVIGRWILGRECRLIRVENMNLEEGKEEFYRALDSITSTLIHDPTLRTMREQY